MNRLLPREKPMPLRYLFVDMNSYFASVEQQEKPHLRGKPVGVIPVDAWNSSCIAASYEAKRHGVKTGTPVWQARDLCPAIRFVEADPQRYVIYHHRIVNAVEHCLPIEKVMSVDEMACKLVGDDRQPERAIAIAKRIKAELREAVGEYVRCSIGIGPNVMLAKVGSDMQKPDGLTVVRTEELPGKLLPLAITDFPGIGPRMAKRFLRAGVSTTEALLNLSLKQMTDVWGSRIHGERWYYLLRGEDLPEKRTVRRSVGHEHVLPPELRTEAGAYAVLVRLTHKAAARMRSIEYWAGALGVNVLFEDGTRWESACRFSECQDTPTLLRSLAFLWADHPKDRKPRKVGMALTNLIPARSATPSLFEDDRRAAEISRVLDDVNREFGASMLYFGSMFGMREHAPTRIPFNRIPAFDRVMS